LKVLTKAGWAAYQWRVPSRNRTVGFRRSAFTEEQLKKLDPLIGNVCETSFLVATYRMYFPFLTCETNDAQL